MFDDIYIALIAGFLIAMCGQILRMATIGLVYIIRGGKNRQIYAEGLVTEGLFSHCRNPLYVGNILILSGLGIMSNSILFILIMIPIFIFFYQAIVLAEENFLRGKFGPSYDKYATSTNRWIPDLKGLKTTLSSMTFNWRRVVIKEYTTTYIWLTGAVLLVIKVLYQLHGMDAVKNLLTLFISTLLLLLTCYFYIRYMKKSRRLIAD